MFHLTSTGQTKAPLAFSKDYQRSMAIQRCHNAILIAQAFIKLVEFIQN